MDTETAFKILELKSNSSLDEVKTQYRDLAIIWHPDKYNNNQRLKKKAEEKFKQINAAYDVLKRHFNDKILHNQTYGSSDSNNDLIVSCNRCGTKNRIYPNINNANPKCGKCGSPLFRSRRSEQRVPCGDAICTGILNESGRCGYCGKTYEEGLAKNREREQRQNAKRSQKKNNFSRYKWPVIIIGAITLIVYSNIHTKNYHINENNINPIKSNNLSTHNLILDIKIANPYAVKNNSIITKNDLNDFDEHYFNNYDRDMAIDLQKQLKTLEYYSGAIDGKIGSATLEAIKHFILDYQISFETLSPPEFLNALAYHSSIYKNNSDWLSILDGNAINLWLNRSAERKKAILKRILESKSPRKICRLINNFKFYKYHPGKIWIPYTKELFNNGKEKIAPLEIVTKNNDIDYYVKLTEVGTSKTVLAAYIRGGTTFKTKVPLGNYEVKYAVGSDWYGERYLFGPRTICSKTDKTFDFRIVGNKVLGYTIELFLQSNGNLKSKEISMYDF